MDKYARIAELLGKPIGDPLLEQLVAYVRVSPQIVDDGNYRSFEFADQGFCLTATMDQVKFFTVAFILEPAGRKYQSWKPYDGELVNSIKISDSRTNVKTKMGTKPFRTEVKRGSFDRNKFYRHDFYKVDATDFWFYFDAETERLGGLFVTRFDVKPSAPASTFAPPRDISNPLLILQQVASVYQSCSSYRDAGKVEDRFNPGSNDEFSVHKVFRTYFRRPHHFLFEWAEVPADNANHVNQVNAVWCEGSATYSYFLGKKEEHATLNDSLQTMVGVSSGASCMVPSLFLPGLAPLAHSRLTEMQMTQMEIERFVKEAEEEPDSALHFRGTLLPKMRTSMFISREDLQVRAVHEVSIISASSGKQMTEKVLKELESSSAKTAEYKDVVDALRKQVNTESENLRISTAYQYDTAIFNDDIGENYFVWSPYQYSELEWAKRGP